MGKNIKYKITNELLMCSQKKKKDPPPLAINTSFYVCSYCILGKIIAGYFVTFPVEFKCAFN